MKIFFRTLRSQEDFDRILMIFYIQVTLMGLALMAEFFASRISGWAFMIKTLMLFLCFKFSYKAISNLYYTFWSFAFCFACYVGAGILQNLHSDGSLQLLYLYFLAMGVLCIQSYLLSSPVYYPRVSWWEYDFRFRNDLPMQAELRQAWGDEAAELQVIPGRLTDLRRQAGCVLLFKDLKVGEEFSLKTSLRERRVHFNAEIVSKREILFGRGLCYGVKFHLQGDEEQELFDEFCQYWTQQKRDKTRLKFSQFRLSMDEP